MCNVNCILFGARNLLDEEIRGRRILEVGSCDVNGSLRPFVESRKPSEYIGIDIVAGPGVDLICSAEDLLDRFAEESFDIVISTELLEHVRNWRKVISNMKRVCKVGGIILITTRSIGFGFHGYPYDYWRYEPEDMKAIFSDCRIEVLEIDPEQGVFLKIKKPSNFCERDLSEYELYSIIAGRRVKDITEGYLKSPHFAMLIAKNKLRSTLRTVASRLARRFIS